MPVAHARAGLIALLLSFAACGALAAPALAGGPATEEYNLDLPSVSDSGSGSGQPADGTSSSSGSSGGGSYSSDGTDVSGSGGGGGSGSGYGYGSGSGAGSSAEHGSGSGKGSHPGAGAASSNGDRGPDAVEQLEQFATSGDQANSIPAIAADVAGEGGMPLLLAGLAAIAGLAGVLYYRRRRARLQALSR